MSGAARRRGAGRAAGEASDTSSRRDDQGFVRPRPGGLDGPASRGSGSGAGSAGRGPSNAGSAAGAAAGASPVLAQANLPAQQKSASGGGRDPALEDEKPKRATDALKNIDLPASFYNIDNLYKVPTEFKKRPGFNTTGKPVQLSLNSYPVVKFPTVRIYQYDVVIGNGQEKRAVQRKIWDSKARKDATTTNILYDGNKLAWSSRDMPEIRLMIDLDAEEGRPPRDGPNANAFRLSIKKSKQLDISVIQGYLEGRIQMNNTVLEAINFFDHLLQEGPTQNEERFVRIKRSFFIRDGERTDLGGGVEVFRGVYQSIRLAEGKRLIVNLDVANTCFWKPSSLTNAILIRYGLRDVQHIAASCKPEQTNGQRRLTGLGRQIEKSFKRVLVTANYPGNPFPDKAWNISGFSVNNPRQEMIDWKNPQTKAVEGKVSIFDYFRRKYNITLKFPDLPLVVMTKKGVMYPMEFLHIKKAQRYPYKLDEKQTANMIKFAVSPPEVRERAINEGKGWLGWSTDPYIKNYGLEIDQNTIKTNARLLPPPGIKFGNKVDQPGTRGKWDLRGKKFLTPNPQELTAWGVGVFTGKTRVDKSQIDNFVANFSRAYRDHGGRVSNQPPHIIMLPADAGQAVEKLHQETGNKYQRRPQLLVFLVQDKQSFHYQRIKKSCDCRYGVVSQVMQLQQVLKGNAQYFSNVLMKVNAKLGGTTTQVQPSPTSGFKSFGAPTMFIGADVSHASPGSPQASMAALTVSMDRFAGRYAAGCQTNGYRVEMISEANFNEILAPCIQHWQSHVGGGQLPKQIFYMRDGVSEGQFLHVMEQEVPHIKAVLSKANQGRRWEGKITVIIASKRHHIRAFPRKGGEASDMKGNPLPGCLIERDCTSPFEFDFFLYSHIALQGTSRPVHYTILHDDANHPPNVIQNMIYEHCYQYIRSTTSVSLHPAVYYAHLASQRARAHEDIPSSQGPQGGPGWKAQAQDSSEPADSETKPLMPMFPANGITFSMWYI